MRNVALNGLEGVVEVLEGPACSFKDMAADLVVANIHFNVIREFLELRSLKEGDLFVLSGLMRSQAAELDGLMDALGLTVLGRWEAEMTWFTIYAVFGDGRSL